MSDYRICPGERCDCQDKEEAAPVLEHRDGKKMESESPNPRSISDFIKRLEEMQV